MTITQITEKLKSPENVEVVQLSIGTRSMHLGHLQEKDGCITISSEKHKIQKSV